jgi:uncharacterized iron-regulated membrane protein
MRAAWHKLLNTPRKLAIRAIVFQIHLWCGIALGLYILLMSLTGVALVFHDEISEYSNRRLLQVDRPVSSDRVIGPDEVRKLAMALTPGHRFNSISFPEGPGGTYRIAMEKKREFTFLYFHPQTGEHLGTLQQDTGFLRWLQLLHFNLLSGTTGRTVNGVGGLCLFLLCLTGVPLWWQGLRRWILGLKVGWRLSWKRINWDLHSATGIYTFCFAALWGLTGAYFAFPDATRAAVGWFLPVYPSVRALRTAKPKADATTKGPTLRLDTLASAASAAAPGTRVTMILFPEAPSLPARVLVMPEDVPASAHHFRGEVFVDRTSAKIVRTSLYQDATSGDVLIRWIVPLHFGTFGGLPIKLLWLFLGLTPGLLAVTGTLLWWNRVASKKFAKRKQASLVLNRAKHTNAMPVGKEVSAR